MKARDRALETIVVETELPTDADRIWQAMCSPGTFLYVCRGLLGFPALAGRTTPIASGESVTGWLWLFHVFPLHRHTIEIVDVDPASRAIRTREHGGVPRRWNRSLRVEPLTDGSCRYRDVVELDAGMLTQLVARFGAALYRYRHRRWRKLVRKHLSAPGRPLGEAAP